MIWLNSWRLSLALLSAAILSVGDVAAQAGTALHSATGSRTGLEKHHPSLNLARLEVREDRVEVLKTRLGDFGLHAQTPVRHERTGVYAGTAPFPLSQHEKAN